MVVLCCGGCGCVVVEAFVYKCGFTMSASTERLKR